MSGLPSHWEIEDVPSQDPRWAIVERVVASSQFQKAPQLRDILVYIAARSLTQNPAAISEYQIGLTVLGRGRDFDPNQDNIVRVRIRHLRTKLEEYFSAEGSNEPVVLTIPKGCYVAKFEPRAVVAADQQPEKNNGAASQAAPFSPVLRQKRLWSIGSAVLMFAVAVALLLWRWDSSSALHSAASSPLVRAGYSFYQDLLGPLGREPSSEARLVLSNPKLMVYVGWPSANGEASDVSKAVPVSPELAAKLAPAINRRDQGLPYHFIRITDQDYTGIGETVTSFYLGQLMQILGRRLGLTQARFLNWDSAKAQNLIIVGSPDINEWAYQNLPKANYSIEKLGIHNEKPKPGEPALYQVVRDRQTGRPLVDHALIWMSRSASGTRILVLAGCTSPATAGVGGFFADPDRMRPVYEKLRADRRAREFPSDWQVILRVNIRDNLPIETTYVSHRVYSTTP